MNWPHLKGYDLIVYVFGFENWLHSSFANFVSNWQIIKTHFLGLATFYVNILKWIASFRGPVIQKVWKRWDNYKGMLIAFY